MADLVQPAHPLKEQWQGLAGTRDAGVRLRLPEWNCLFQVLAFAGRATAVSEVLAKLGSAQAISVRDSLPGEWLVLCEKDLENTLADAFGNDAATIDQSHGRIGVVLEGPGVRPLLAKGTAVDLHSDAFAAGLSVNTMFGHFAVHLTRTGNDTFELIVARSFADAFFEMLIETGSEFDLTAG